MDVSNESSVELPDVVARREGTAGAISSSEESEVLMPDQITKACCSFNCEQDLEDSPAATAAAGRLQTHLRTTISKSCIFTISSI